MVSPDVAGEPEPPHTNGHGHSDRAAWRESIYRVIFHHDTPASRGFDLVLLWAILLSVATVTLESVAAIQQSFETELLAVEWIFTALFTVEYVLRLLSARRPGSYAFSFFGVVDLVSVLPAYVGLLFVDGGASLTVIRSLRLLRVFRIMRLGRFLREAGVLVRALVASSYKIGVFLGSVLVLALIMGAVMYLVEGPENGFTSIPRSMYWAVVTLTTVGYGDIAPRTDLGQALAAVVMIVGYSIIAVPTGIVSVELAEAARESMAPERDCEECGTVGHAEDAAYCRVCGKNLE